MNYDYETEFFSVLMTNGQFFCRAVDSNQGLYQRFSVEILGIFEEIRFEKGAFLKNIRGKWKLCEEMLEK